MAKARLADLHHLVDPEAAGRDATDKVRNGDWPELERRKQEILDSLMKGPVTRPKALRPPRPWGKPSQGLDTPSQGLVGDIAVTIEEYQRHERREPVSFGLPPLTLPRSYGTAYGWMRTAGEAQSEPQALVPV